MSLEYFWKTLTVFDFIGVVILALGFLIYIVILVTNP
jgi:hypothetical protein